MIQGVIFDMDGLMFDTERLWDDLWAPCCEQMGLPLPPQEFLDGGRGLAGENLKKHIRAYYPQTDPQEMLDVIWQIAEERFAAGVPCKPGLKELLAYLAQRGLPCIVASSSPRNMIERNLQNTGTAPYFREVVCGYDVAHSKPAPDIFLEAARRMGLPPKHCLVLEDSFNGVRAGRAAGCPTVMVPDLLPPTEEIKALYTACCKDLFAVKAMLERGEL